MAQKRKAQEAFGKPKPQLSAFAAARLAKQSKQVPSVEPTTAIDKEFGDGNLVDATTLGQMPYDGNHADISAGEAEDESEIIVAPPTQPASGASLSTFRSTNRTLAENDDGSLTIKLREGESVVCVGVYDIAVQEGLATIFGAVLRPNGQVFHVYAPSTHALPSIVARRDGTVLRIASVQSSLRKLERLSPLFRNIWTKDLEHSSSFILLQRAADDDMQRALTALEVDTATDSVVSRLSTESESTARLTRIMAIGAKSSGKSTLNRLLCNTLVTKPNVKKVLYLDLDPGQPEFGPPGQVSLVEVTVPLLGPPFSHPASKISSKYRLLRTHAIAATSFKDDPEHYINCAKDLIRYADRQYPLIVNSCGWVTGLGLNVQLELSTILDMSDIILLEPVDVALSQTLRLRCPDTSFHQLARQPARPSARTPAEMRAMQTMAYFHHRSQRTNSIERWSSKPISEWRPWIASYDGPTAGVQAILSYGQSPSPDFLAEVLDGAVLAIVVLDKDNVTEAYNLTADAEQASSLNALQAEEALPSSSERIRITNEGLPYLLSEHQGSSSSLDPRFSQCVGLALIRAIDAERKELHLVTSLPEKEIAALLDQHVVLIRGSFDAPEWAYLEDVYAGDKSGREMDVRSRPWVTKREPVGIEGAVWRLRHPPMAGDVR